MLRESGLVVIVPAPPAAPAFRLLVDAVLLDSRDLGGLWARSNPESAPEDEFLELEWSQSEATFSKGEGDKSASLSPLRGPECRCFCSRCSCRDGDGGREGHRERDREDRTGQDRTGQK